MSIILELEWQIFANIMLFARWHQHVRFSHFTGGFSCVPVVKNFKIWFWITTKILPPLIFVKHDFSVKILTIFAGNFFW